MQKSCHCNGCQLKNIDEYTNFEKCYCLSGCGLSNSSEENGAQVEQQYRTSTGPINILALNKNKSDFLVVELKRDRASDPVIGKTTRYMGWVEENLCNSKQSVNGLIIAHQQDENLRLSLSQNDKIGFLRYEVDFRLVG